MIAMVLRVGAEVAIALILTYEVKLIRSGVVVED